MGRYSGEHDQPFGYDFGASRGAGGQFASEDPDYVAVPVKFNGKTWKKVGFRLKGNSSLSSIWGSGNYKFPCRLNVDKLEDTYPAIKNQRIYRFQELSFAPGWSDASLIREKATADIMYSGVYTMVEVIDDTMVKDQFGEDDGNIYKPESTFQSFVESEFEKKNNKSSTFTDVQTMATQLNSSLRAHLRTFNTTIFNTTTLGAMFDRYTALISPFVVGANGDQVGYTHTSAAQFTAALPTLKPHLANRKSLVTSYVP
ncbi:MAG: CotH kinase family protein [Gemmatimonadota bacterium]